MKAQLGAFLKWAPPATAGTCLAAAQVWASVRKTIESLLQWVVATPVHICISVGLLVLYVLVLIWSLRTSPPEQTAQSFDTLEKEEWKVEEEKPALQVRINGTSCEHMLWILPWPARRRYLSDLAITVANCGKETVDDITVMLELSSSLYPAGLPRKSDAIAEIQEFKRAEAGIEGTEKTRVIYRLPMLHPNVSTVINDTIFFLNSSRVEIDSDHRTADGKMVNIRTSLLVGFNINISISARNISPVLQSLKLMLLQGDDHFLLGLRNPEAVASKVAEEIAKGHEPERAAVLRLNHPDKAPADVPKKFSKDAREAKLSKAIRTDAVFFKEFGYFPLEFELPEQLAEN